jgi:hypothetical protein
LQRGDRRGKILEIWAPSSEYTARETRGIGSAERPILKPRDEIFSGFLPEHIVSWMRMTFGLRLWIILLRDSFFGAPPTPRALKERKIIYPLSMGFPFSKGPCDGSLGAFVDFHDLLSLFLLK